jgi:hypothetical protein
MDGAFKLSIQIEVGSRIPVYRFELGKTACFGR